MIGAEKAVCPPGSNLWNSDLNPEAPSDASCVEDLGVDFLMKQSLGILEGDLCSFSSGFQTRQRP